MDRRASTSRLLTFSTKQRQQCPLCLDGRFLPRKPAQTPDHQRELPQVFAAESAHHEVQTHLEANVPRQRGIEELARAFRYLSTIQHVMPLRHRHGPTSAAVQRLLHQRADLGSPPMQQHPLISLAYLQDVTDVGGVHRLDIPEGHH